MRREHAELAARRDGRVRDTREKQQRSRKINLGAETASSGLDQRVTWH